MTSKKTVTPVEQTPAQATPIVKEPPTYPGREGKFQWSPKRVALIRALRALGAVGAENGRSKKEVALKSGLPLNEVGHFLYKDNDLCTSGFVRYIKNLEGVRGGAYFLTQKGATVKLPS